mgnify:CR=1 FL=1
MLFLKIYYHIMAIIKKFFYKIIYGKHIKFGKGVTFRKGFSLVIEDDAFVTIGNGCFFNNYCSINAKEGINIGNNCLFGENVKIYDHDHDYKNNLDNFVKKQIKIGNKVWIGSNSTILKGVGIGNNVVVAEGTTIREYIENNTLTYQKKHLVKKNIYNIEEE